MVILVKAGYGQHAGTEVPLQRDQDRRTRKLAGICSQQRNGTADWSLSKAPNVVQVRQAFVVPAAGGCSDLAAQKIPDGTAVLRGYANGVLGGSRDPYEGWSTVLRAPYSAAVSKRPSMGSPVGLRQEHWHGSGITRDFIEDPSPARIFRNHPPSAVHSLPVFRGGCFQWPERLPTPVMKRPAEHTITVPAPRQRPKSVAQMEDTKNFVNDYAVGSLNRGSIVRGKNRVRGGQNYGQNLMTGHGFDER